MTETIWITFAFGLGLLVRGISLPPLVGYLAAGFLLNAFGDTIGLPIDNGKILAHVAHIGVLLLLFTVGLKLRLRNLLRPEVIGGGLLHFAITCLLLTPAIYLLLVSSWETALLLAIALGFSSTVLAAKVLEAKRELRAFHGRVAIGILIVQDLIALLVMSIAGGQTPSIWALGVLALPLLRPLLYRLLDASGHDELLVLLGLLLALVIGGHGFEAVGLSSELGALLFGALLANHDRAKELGDALWSIKEVFLVGFFLQIGMEGLPDARALGFALLFGVLLPLKAALFFFLLILFRLRARSAFLTGISLASYSEFGLIMANVVLPEWLVPLALTVAISFVFAAPLNRIAHSLYERLEARLTGYELDRHHPDEQPVSLGRAHILIMGMGRAGTAAYDFLRQHHERLIGLDSDPAKVERHRQQGRRVLYADAEDPGFWKSLRMDHVEAVILGMNDIEAKMIAARQLRQRGFGGLIVAHTLHQDEAERIVAAGADQAYLTFSEAGVGLAEHVRESLPELLRAADAR